jgi:hypothetical protein
MGRHSDYRFSITIQSSDLAVVYCLRALSAFSQKRGNKRIPWGGTKDAQWIRDGHRITLRFSSAEFRDDFISQLQRLLPLNLWSFFSQSDEDPAKPQ